jgi:hypothetical protein
MSEDKGVEVVKLDPKTWDRGRGNLEEVFLSGPNGMCCLGFAALQICGARLEDIKQRDAPVSALGVRWPTYLLDGNWCNTVLTNDLMRINDRVSAIDEERVKALNLAAIEHGAPIRFELVEGEGDDKA